MRQYRRPADTSAQSEGSVQTLAGGNVFVGFGAQPFFSEFSSKGRMLFDASLPQDDGSYRAYRFPWKATPRTRPDVAARRSGPTAVSVYASWNGATDVVRWQVLAGPSATSLAPLSSAARSDFETRIDVTSAATTLRGARARREGTRARDLGPGERPVTGEPLTRRSPTP